MTIITDQQGRILYYPNENYPEAYLIPNKEKSYQIQKSQDNSFFYACLIILPLFVFMALGFIFLGNPDSNYFHKFSDDSFDFNMYKMEIGLAIPFFIYFFIIEPIRFNWIVWDLPRISRKESFEELSKLKSIFSIIFDMGVFLFIIYFLLIQSKNFILEESSLLIIGIGIILFILIIYNIMIKKIITDIMIIFYKIHQSWRKR